MVADIIFHKKQSKSENRPKTPLPLAPLRGRGSTIWGRLTFFVFSTEMSVSYRMFFSELKNIVPSRSYLLLGGGWTEKPNGWDKSRSLPRVTCMQKDTDSGLTQDPSTREQTLLRKKWCVGLAQCNN